MGERPANMRERWRNKIMLLRVRERERETRSSSLAHATGLLIIHRPRIARERPSRELRSN